MGSRAMRTSSRLLASSFAPIPSLSGCCGYISGIETLTVSSLVAYADGYVAKDDCFGSPQNMVLSFVPRHLTLLHAAWRLMNRL